jgi:hypothetical protein
MVLWSAGISTHATVLPKPVDKGDGDPQLRMNLDDLNGTGDSTHEMRHWSRTVLWMKA